MSSLRIGLPRQYEIKVENERASVVFPIGDGLATHLREQMDLPVAILGLSHDNLRLLLDNRIAYIGQLLRDGIPEFGRSRRRYYSPEQIRHMLANRGLRIGTWLVDWEPPEIRLAKQAAIDLANKQKMLWPILDSKFVNWAGALPDKKTRIRQICRDNGINLIGELVQKTEAEMLALKGVGKKSIELLKLRVLSGHSHVNDLHFGMVSQELAGWLPPDQRVTQGTSVLNPP